MQDVLEFILKNITTMPDDVKIEVQEEEGTSNYIITVNPVDVGRIIGKEGKIIKAIRTIMRVIAIQRGVHIRVSVVSENDAPATQMVDGVEVAPEIVEQPTVEEAAPQEEEDDGTITVEV